MKSAFRLLVAAALLGSAGYSLLRLKDLAAAKRLLSEPGASPEAVLAKLAADDRSGAVKGLVEAQLAQDERLRALTGGSGPDGTPLAPEPEPEEPPMAPGGQRLLSVRRGDALVGSGSGVLIDHKTGERIVVGGGRGWTAGLLPRPGRGRRPMTLRSLFSDDLDARRNRAYALLLGTAAVAVVLVLRARRGLRA